MRKIRKHNVYIILKFQLAIKNTENQHISEFKYKFLRKKIRHKYWISPQNLIKIIGILKTICKEKICNYVLI